MLHAVNVVESASRIDSNFCDLTTSNIVGSSLNVESVAVGNLAFGDVAAIIEVVQFTVIKVQATLWKPHCCYPFVRVLVINDNLHVDIVNPQMLRCIICKSKQTKENVLIESCYILRKGFKCNGVTPMKTHTDYAHPKLLATRKK